MLTGGFAPVEKALWLQRICEANYERLLCLAPDLPRLGPEARAPAADKPALCLRLLERSRHTLLLELSHDFRGLRAERAEPAARLRVCLDARTVEMLGDRARPPTQRPVDRSLAHALDRKWTLNYFLYRWLEHCLASDYRFEPVTPSAPLA